MKCILIKPRGFCAGVVRAIRTVEKALFLFGPPIYVHHEIVHNRHVVDQLKKKGAVFVEDIEEVPSFAKVIYSAHGVSPWVRKISEEKNHHVIDATCTLVHFVHDAVKKYAKKDYQIVLLGHKNHIEIIGTKDEAPDNTTIIESVEDIDRLTFDKDQKLFFATQTTLSVQDTKEIQKKLKTKYPHMKTLSRSCICYATYNRQKALLEGAKEADLVLVVGDNKSSNSNRLKELMPNSYLINDENEIKKKWLESAKIIAVTAGASTPEQIVQKCIKKLKSLGISEIEDYSYKDEFVTFPLPL